MAQASHLQLPSTQILHADRKDSLQYGELHAPVYRNIAYHYDQSADIAAVFQGNKKGYTYGRQTNPSLTALEKKISMLEGGLDSVLFASGMAAISSMLFALLQQGDQVIASSYLFGNTRSLLESFIRFGIELVFVDTTDVKHVEQRLNEKTKLVFLETLANPRTQISDLKRIGELCLSKGILYVVDNTMTSPALFQPKQVQAGLIINSLSKYIGGHGACLGGSLTETGLFDWSQFSNIAEIYRKYPVASQGLMQIRKKGLRDMGGTLSPDSANLLALGLETLTLRMATINRNALAIAQFLANHPLIQQVYYPGLAQHPQHQRATTLFASYGGLMSFELVEHIDLNQFIDRLQYFVCSSNLGDNRSLVIPVAQTIFYEIGSQKRKEMAISEQLIRLSVGIEPLDDLLADLDQALTVA
ncbi:MAG: hypothetical protein CR991_00085 [Proteobacteria bacterium]|nr:MAG: hypothetical protein CR991_00085 [Pseudomonadota bacterium]